MFPGALRVLAALIGSVLDDFGEKDSPFNCEDDVGGIFGIESISLGANVRVCNTGDKLA